MRPRLLHFITAAGLWSAGCATSSWPIDPGDPVTLRPGQGLLVVHVKTNRPLRSIDVGGVQAAEDVSEGTHVRLIGITAGTYRWVQIDLQEVAGSTRYETFRFRPADRLRFRVEPGAINYVGMIEVERSGPSVWMNSIDRTAMALEQLRKEHPDLLAKYPTVYSGPARHVFLERHRDAAAKRESRLRDADNGRVP